MKLKSVLAVALLGFVVIALAWALINPAEPIVEGEGTTPAVAGPAVIDNGVVAYYLHPESRCATCLKIEEQSLMALKDNFSGAMADGRLQWLSLNVDQPENKPLMAEFELHTTSLVLAERKDGETVRFRNCTRVWELVHSPMKFDLYVAEETADMLGDV